MDRLTPFKSLLVRLSEDEEVAADVADRTGHQIGLMQREFRRIDCANWDPCEEGFVADLMALDGAICAQAKCPDNCPGFIPRIPRR